MVCHLVSPAKTAEAIEVPFALKTRVGPRNHLLDISERFQPNTVLWAFHTIQPSSFSSLILEKQNDSSSIERKTQYKILDGGFRYEEKIKMRRKR